MFKKLIIGLPALVLIASISTEASANQCSGSQVQELEHELKAMQQMTAHAAHDPNQERKAAEMKRIEERKHFVEHMLRSCKEGKAQKCSAQMVQHAKESMKHFSEIAHKVHMIPNRERREQELTQLKIKADQASEILRFCHR